MPLRCMVCAWAAKGRSGAGGIDFFKQGDSGSAANETCQSRRSDQIPRINTVLTYGEQMPALPVLNHDNSRLLPGASPAR